jgi:hypothetical protein
LTAGGVARYIAVMNLEPGDRVQIHADYHNDPHPYVRSRVGMVGLVREQFCERSITVVAWPDGNSTHDTHTLELIEAYRARIA